MITFTENEARLNISHVLNSTSGAVLFTEGITDELIIEIAWMKLFPKELCPFEIQNAFDRIFLRNLFSRDELKTTILVEQCLLCLILTKHTMIGMVLKN